MVNSTIESEIKTLLHEKYQRHNTNLSSRDKSLVIAAIRNVAKERWQQLGLGYDKGIGLPLYKSGVTVEDDIVSQLIKISNQVSILRSKLLFSIQQDMSVTMKNAVTPSLPHYLALDVLLLGDSASQETPPLPEEITIDSIASCIDIYNLFQPLVMEPQAIADTNMLLQTICTDIAELVLLINTLMPAKTIEPRILPFLNQGQDTKIIPTGQGISIKNIYAGLVAAVSLAIAFCVMRAGSNTDTLALHNPAPSDWFHRPVCFTNGTEYLSSGNYINHPSFNPT